jgi:FlaA1/EpsC-like NDP-sugar epimerase
MGKELGVDREASVMPHRAVKRFRELAKIAVDLAIWTLAGVAAFALRVPSRWGALAPLAGWYLLTGIPIQVSLIVTARLHRQYWRRTTVEDVYRLAIAVGAGSSVMFAIGLVWFLQGLPFPRTVPVIQGVLALLGMVGVRLWIRTREASRPGSGGVTLGESKRVLLVGAGEAGTHIGWEIRRRRSSGLHVIGFLDDNPAKARLSIAGTRVLGRIEDLPEVARQHRIDLVFITMPAAGGRVTRRVAELASAANVECRILPGITQVLSGDVTLAGVRPIEFEDLLRRPPFEHRVPVSYVRGRSILVTGAGGSIGSELVRQTALLEPDHLILFGHGEGALHKIDQELRVLVPELRTTVVIGDVRDRSKAEHVFRRFEPAIVFHAAAHKHLPYMEADPDEAILNNVGGTRNLAQASLMTGVDRFVNVSTDKAVRPSSILGATKSLAESVVRMAASRATGTQTFVSVRFGNVLGSSGSVVEGFQEQIRRGGPLTVTDPEMTRYFMTIPEASRLVIEAGGFEENGAVYVLNMGTPVRIVDLAKDMIHLAGFEDDGMDIIFTGRRPGEKLHESLFDDDERFAATSDPGILVARDQSVFDESTDIEIDRLIAAAERRDWPDMDRLLRRLLPRFRPDRPISDDVVNGQPLLSVIEELR